MEPEFKAYQQQEVKKNAKAMAEVFMSRGYDVISGGTEGPFDAGVSGGRNYPRVRRRARPWVWRTSPLTKIRYRMTRRVLS